MTRPTRLSPLRIRTFFAALRDPRRRRGRITYPLVSLIVIALCATIAGANTTEQIATWARAHRAWLLRVIELPDDPKKMPSHDTFERVLAALNPVTFQQSLLNWLHALQDIVPGVIAIDGKVAREAMARAGEQGPLTLVSAWATANHVILGQVAGESGSNELGALPKLLELLELHGAIVTLDALGCQKEIVEQIVTQGGDYVISVKGNQPTLEAKVHEVFAAALDGDIATKTKMTNDDGHGRAEQRCYVVVEIPKDEPEFKAWRGATSLVMAVREYIDGKGEKQRGERYYISSLSPKVKALADAVRGHWKVENELHWVLDVAFREDRSRARKANAQANLGILRRTALSLIKNTPELQGSIDSRRKQIGWDSAMLEKVLFQRKDS